MVPVKIQMIDELYFAGIFVKLHIASRAKMCYAYNNETFLNVLVQGSSPKISI